MRSIWHRLDEPQPWSDVIEIIDAVELTIEHQSVVVAADVLRRPLS